MLLVFDVNVIKGTLKWLWTAEGVPTFLIRSYSLSTLSKTCSRYFDAPCPPLAGSWAPDKIR